MNTGKRSPAAGKILEYLTLALAALFILAFLGTALKRISYPFELEWMEGAMVDGVQRVLEGRDLYVQPGVDYIPFIYSPLYFYLSAGVSLLTGTGFLPLRLVSLLSAGGVLILIHLYIRRETGQSRWGLVGAGLFAAAYALTDGWFDIARVDSLFLLLLLCGIYLLRFSSSTQGLLLASILLSLSFFSKQSALIVCLPLLFYWLLFKRGTSRWLFPLCFTLLVGAGSLILNHQSGGWFAYYVFRLPSQHELLLSMLYHFWLVDIFKPLIVAFMLAALYIIHLWQEKNKPDLFFYLFLLAGLFGASYAGRLHPNGFINVLLPAYLGLALATPMGFIVLRKELQQYAEQKKITRSRAILSAVLLLQFCLLLYNPLDFIPTPEDRKTGETLIASIRSIEGEVYFPQHGYYSSMAGKQSYAHAMAISDVLSGDEKSIQEKMKDSLRLAIREKRFAAILLDWDWLPDEMDSTYSCRPLDMSGPDAFWPVTGMLTRPEQICTRIP